MIGKVWIFITAFSFITYVHHARSACMPNDIKTHLDDVLLEEHMFEIKVFSSETKEHELISVINTLCSTWTKNKNKDKDKLSALITFEIMLDQFFSDNFESFCANLNCTDAYTVSRVNTTVFGDMYRRSCNGSISDLKCPSKSTTISPNNTAAESTTFFTTVESIITAHTSTTVSPNITYPENLSTVSSASTKTNNAQNLRSTCESCTIKTCSGVLVVSLLLNILLFLLVLKCHLNTKKNKLTAEQVNPHGEVRLLRDRQQMESSHV